MFGFSGFSEAPFSAEALNDYTLSCSAGSYTITGGNAIFSLGKSLSADAGSYSTTGNQSNFLYSQVIQGGAGSYALTGADAEFVYSQVLNGNAGSYAITGNNASFSYNQVIYAGAFNFAITGNNAELNFNKVLSCESGIYSIAGGDAEFLKTKSLLADTGSYDFTGQSAELNYEPIPVFVVESKGGLPKKKRTTKIEIDRKQRKQLEAIVRREFDILDGTYEPEVVEAAKETILPKIKEIDYTQYQIALAQVNALLLQAKIQAAEYESELDDEEALLMLL